jgi:hypothetical protein
MLEMFLRTVCSVALVSAVFDAKREHNCIGPVQIASANLTGGYLSIGEGPQHEGILVRILRALPSPDSDSFA